MMQHVKVACTETNQSSPNTTQRAQLLLLYALGRIQPPACALDLNKVTTFFAQRNNGTLKYARPKSQVFSKKGPVSLQTKQAAAKAALAASVANYMKLVDNKEPVSFEVLRGLCPLLQHIMNGNLLNSSMSGEALVGLEVKTYKADLYFKTRNTFAVSRITFISADHAADIAKEQSKFAALQASVLSNDHTTQEWKNFVAKCKQQPVDATEIVRNFDSFVSNLNRANEDDAMTGLANPEEEFKKAMALFKSDEYNLRVLNATGVKTKQCAVKNAAFQTLFGFTHGVLDRNTMCLKKIFERGFWNTQRPLGSVSFSGAPALYHVCRFIDTALKDATEFPEYTSAKPFQPPAAVVLRGKPIVDEIRAAIAEVYNANVEAAYHENNVAIYFGDDVSGIVKKCQEWETTFCDKYVAADEDLMLGHAATYTFADECFNLKDMSKTEYSTDKTWFDFDEKTLTVENSSTLKTPDGTPFHCNASATDGGYNWFVPVGRRLPATQFSIELLHNTIEIKSLLSGVTTPSDTEPLLLNRLHLLGNQMYTPANDAGLLDMRQTHGAILEYKPTEVAEKWNAYVLNSAANNPTFTTSLTFDVFLTKQFAERMIQMYHTNVYATSAENAMLLHRYFRLEPSHYFTPPKLSFAELRDSRFINECIYSTQTTP